MKRSTLKLSGVSRTIRLVPALRDTFSASGYECEHIEIKCQAFLLCNNPATVTLPHPILGTFQACQRCADKLAAIDRLSATPQGRAKG